MLCHGDWPGIGGKRRGILLAIIRGDVPFAEIKLRLSARLQARQQWIPCECFGWFSAKPHSSIQ